MHIKDVEKLTGLTKKSIRYYESKGLLSVKRDQNNDYREYSEADVEVLRRIRLYRFLDFSIEEIRKILEMEPAEVEKELQKKVDHFEKQTIENDLKKDICIRLKKNGNYDELYKEVEILDGEVMENVKNTLFELSHTNVYVVIANTLILLGPIAWLFINIHEKKWEALYLNSILALIATVLLWCLWTTFVKFWKNHKDQLKKENKKNRLLIPVAFFSLVFCLTCFVGMSVLQEKILMPADFLFYEAPHGVTCLLILALILAFFLVVAWLLNRYNIRSMGDYDVLIDWIKDKKAARMGALVVFFLILYSCFTTVNVVTTDKIILYRPWNMAGTVYDYNEVQSVDARFKRNGDFRYILYLESGKAAFETPGTNSEIERYQNDTYLELEEFDGKLMELGITKTSDGSNCGKADLDQVYIDRFQRIINNK